MKPDSSMEEMKADSSTTRMYTNMDEVQTMDTASDCKFIYSTPQVWKTDNGAQGSATMTVHSSYSVDSGISDTFNSTWTSSINDVSSLSAQCSPESDTGNKRLELKAYECSCSPIKRVSATCIQGRRLTFTESDFRARKFPVPEITASERETVGFCEKSVASEEVDDLTEAQTGSLPVSKSIVCNYQGQSCFGSPDSVIDDDLEVGLQDMALGELLPHVDCAPSMNLKSVKCVQTCSSNQATQTPQRGSRALTQCCLFCQHMSGSCRDTSRSQCSHTETSLLKCAPNWAYRKPESSDFCDTQTFQHRIDANLKFHNKLSLASPQNPQTPGHAASGQDIADYVRLSSAIQLFPDGKISPNGEHSLLLQSYTWPWSIADRPDHGGDAVKSNYDKHNSFMHNHAQNVHPSKRSSDCTEVCSSPLGPPKVRRTHMLINEDRASVMKIHRKCASGQISDKKGSFVLDCGTHKVDNLHLYNSSSLHLVNLRHIEEAKSTCDKLEEPAITRSDSFYENNTEDIKKEGGLDHFNHRDRLKRCLEELKKLYPQDSSRIIGRNVGIGKFDIVCELYLKNVHLCLEAIFYHLADSDLASIVAVSTGWKQAMYNDHKAYNRYRQHKKSLSERHFQNGSGKENTGEKPANECSSLTLTQSRGLLSSMQSQAKTRLAPEPPTPVAAKDVLMCDDTLRVCPHCQGPAMIRPCQDRAVCMNNKCAYDFCTLCFTRFHYPRPCKPLCKAPSRADLAGTKKSKKNLKRL